MVRASRRGCAIGGLRERGKRRRVLAETQRRGEGEEEFTQRHRTFGSENVGIAEKDGVR